VYHHKPVAFPPIFPIPGDEIRVTNGGFSWPAHPLPMYMGTTFTSLCKLWVTVQEVLSVYFSPDSEPLQKRVFLSFAEEKYQKLLLWANSLTASMFANVETKPGHVFISQ
jgi:hypothetical protein